MNMLAFSTLACPGWSREMVLEKAAKFGYEEIEWRGGPDGHIPPETSVCEMASLRKAAADRGLAALAITAYTSFVSPLESERQVNVQELQRYADLAAELGAPFVRAFLGELPPGTALDGTTYSYIFECLSLASAYATTVGVRIAIEPHDDFVHSSAVAPVLDQDALHPALCAIWDVGNTFAAGEPPEQSLAILKDRLAYVQVKDGRRRDSGWSLCAIGEGDVPLRRAFELLSNTGYEGAISLEWEYAWHPELDPPEAALPAGLRVIRELLSAVESSSPER
jgi:sugar phosphate isomerase/epimerase